MTVKNILFFVVGVAAGAGATYKYWKDYFEDISNNDISEAKEYYKELYSGNDKESEEKEIEEKTPVKEAVVENRSEKPGIIDYAKTIKNEGYTDYSKPATESEDTPHIYIIKPIEYGDRDDWNQETITFHVPSENYEDEYGELMHIDTVKECIGNPDDVVKHFGEYEEDSVFVRNEELKTDYEVLKDLEEWEG